MDRRGAAPLLIVFIATMVLAVALVAVLVERSGAVRESSRSTGHAALALVRSGVFAYDVSGESNGSGIDALRATLRLAGSEPLPLASLVVLFETGDAATYYRYSGSALSSVSVDGRNGTFGVEYVQLAGSGDPLLSDGDVIVLSFPTPSSIGPRRDVAVVFTTAAGVTARVSARTPGVLPAPLTHLYP